MFNGRNSLVQEIKDAGQIAMVIAEKFARYLKNHDIEDAVTGFVQTESNPDERLTKIMNSFYEIAECQE